MREIWEEYSEVQKILWENLTVHQKAHGWPSRTMSLADLVDGLITYKGSEPQSNFYAVYMTDYDDNWGLEYVVRTHKEAKERVERRMPSVYSLHWCPKVIEGNVCEYAVGYYDEKYRVELYTI